jgi:YD repeat-containing protein
MTAYRYDERGLVTEEVSRTGARRTYAYDAHLNLTAIVEANGTWRFLRRTREGCSRAPIRPARDAAYDSARGDLLGSATRPAGDAYTYDGEGHLTQVVDAKGRITALRWRTPQARACKDANGTRCACATTSKVSCGGVQRAREIHRLRYDTAGNRSERRRSMGEPAIATTPAGAWFARRTPPLHESTHDPPAS